MDEGAFAEATREMVVSGDYGFTTLDGSPRFDKPILVYWLQAASVGALGVSEGAVRLPSALCAFGWCLAVATFARRRWGLRTGLLAGTVMATSAGLLVIGRASTADALLNLLLCLTMLDAWRYLESGRKGPLRRAYLWIGLGLLAKGPIALIIPAGVSLLYLLSRRELGRWLRLAFDGPGWAILLGLAAPWYAYALHRYGMEFVDGFLVRHNLSRYSTTLEGHGGSLFYYVLMLPVLLLPWAAFLPRVARSARELWREPVDRFLLLWVGFVLAFFSFSGTKLPHYALYGATPAFLLLGRAVARAGRAERWAGAGLLVFLLLALAIAPGLVPWAAGTGLVRDPLYAALLSGAGAGAAAVQVGAAAALAGFALALARWRPTPAVLAGGAAALALVLTTLATPWLGEALQGPVKRAGLAARELGRPVVQWKVRVPSFSLYRGAPTPHRPPEPGELALTKEAAISTLPHGSQVVWRERGYALVRAAEPPLPAAEALPPTGEPPSARPPG